MGNIERWECPNGCGTEPQPAAAPEGVERWRCYPCGVDAVKVEYVPASQLQGAVGEIEALRHWIDVAARNCPANGEVDAILVESRRRVPPAGGQYEAAPPNKQG